MTGLLPGMLPGERLTYLGDDGELHDVIEVDHQLFTDAQEAFEADVAAGFVVGDPEEIGRRAAAGGTDPVSVAVAAIERRMSDQEGHRGFRVHRLEADPDGGYITRWRFAALIFLRWVVGGWLSLALVPAPAEVVPPVVPAPELVTCRKIRYQVTARMTNGPNSRARCRELAALDRSGP
jgi:hypothetical protein